MNQDRWKTVNHIFHAALEVSASERSAFVESASNGDADLKAEVELLLQADQDAGSYIESPLVPGNLFATSPPPLHPGDVISGRFRILREIAEGGMGQVFEAFDTELAVRVAVKIIRPEVAANPEVLARFRQEVRLARQITHPNVCRTFDIQRDSRVIDPVRGTTHELVFLTMEFLEGETLASRIARSGPLTLDEAQHIARQVGDALGAAHSLGIVHRDMKPANIMLVPTDTTGPLSFRAVITDFGLARLDPLLSSRDLSALSHTGRPIGTLAYMAPEQLEGARVSPATDVYALGLILFEMVTGARAFPSDNFLSDIAKRLTGPSPSPRTIVPALPQPWCRAIEGCLRPLPAERFQTASEVLTVLDGGRVSLPPSSTPRTAGRFSFLSRESRIRVPALFVIFLLAVSLFVAGLRIFKSRADSTITPGALVYLTPVKNQTGEKAFDNLTELLQAGVTQSAQINLLDQGRIGDILQQMTKSPDTAIDEPIAREIAMRAGAVRVVFASVTRTAGNYELDIDIQQPDNTPVRYREHWTKSFAWQVSNPSAGSSTIPPELLVAIRNASDWIRREAGESANDIARLDVPPQDVTTSSWQALSQFTDSRRLLQKNRPADAALALERAVQLDPQFALAYASLGDVLLSLHRDREGFQAYDKALDSALQDRLTRREEDRIRGMRAVDTMDYELAVDSFHDLVVNYPADVGGWVYPVTPLRMLNRDEEAIADLRKAIALQPNAAFAPYALAQELMIQGRFQEVPQWIDRLRSDNHPDEANEDEAILHFLSGDYDRAELILQSMASSDSAMRRSYSYQDLASLDAERGRFADAINILDRGIVEDSAQNNSEQHAAKLLARAYLECRLSQFDACLSDTHSAIDIGPTPQHMLLADTVLGSAAADAPRQFSVRIRQELERIARSVEKPGFGNLAELLKLRTQGEIQLAAGNPSAALHTFESAASKDASAGSREYLGRALLAAASVEHDQRAAGELRNRARAAYAAIALKPAIVWCDLEAFPPGFYADQLSSFINLSTPDDLSAPAVGSAAKSLAMLRGQTPAHPGVSPAPNTNH